MPAVQYTVIEPPLQSCGYRHASQPAEHTLRMPFVKVAEAGPLPRFIIIDFGHFNAVYQHAAPRIKRNAPTNPSQR